MASVALEGCASTPKAANVPAQAKFEDAALAKGVTKTGMTFDPKDETDVFMTDEQQAVMWLKIGDLAGAHRLRWDWYDPKGNLYVSSGDYTINRDGQYRAYNTSWHKIAVKDEKAADLPGKWTVKAFLDNKQIAAKNFDIRKLSEFRTLSKGKQLAPDKHKWALVIAIEKYRKTVPVQFAENDANDMKVFLTARAGVPEENVVTLMNENATKADIEVVLKDRLRGMLREGDTLYVYYAGHGIPADASPYLLPYDGDPDSPAITAYSVDGFYSDLDQLPAKNVIVFLDTCFSGRSGREEKEGNLMVGARPGVLKVRDPLLASNKIVALSAAKSNQLSNYYQEEGHGLFTYYLLKGLVGGADMNKDGHIQMGELSRYVQEEVGSTSRRLFGLARQQNPVAMPAFLTDKETITVSNVMK